MRFSPASPLSRFASPVLFLVALALAGCDQYAVENFATPAVEGSGVSATATRQVPSFSRIEAAGQADIEASLGPVQSVTLTSDDNVLPLIETTVADGTLRIRSSHSYRNNLGLKVRIVVPSLAGVSLNGAAKITASGLDAPALSVKLSGASSAALAGKAGQLEAQVSGAAKFPSPSLVAQDVSLDASGASRAEVCARQSSHGLSVSGSARITVSGLDAPALVVKADGAGTVTLAGQAVRLEVHTAGAGRVQAENLVAQNVTVEASGASHAEVSAAQSLDATVSGGAAVRYGGSPPQVRSHVSGAGSVKPL